MAVLTAFEFLTALRFRRPPILEPQRLARSQPFFPLVGLALGLILVGLDRAFLKVLAEPAVDWVLVVGLVLLTGGLHLEGLADACDGLFGGHTREQRLEIMRDPRIGAYGAIALLSVLALKWAGLASLPPAVRVEGLLLAPCLSRWALLPAMAAFPYAREEGLGRAFHPSAGWAALTLGGVTALTAAAALLGWAGPVLAVATAATALLLGLYATVRLGGLTGDVYGALVEAGEVATLLLIAAGARRGWIEPLLLG